MGEDDDVLIDFGDQRVRVPNQLARNVPWARQAVMGARITDGATVLAFVTHEPTVEAIASGGVETVASVAVAMSPANVRQLLADLTRFAETLPPS